MFHATIIVCWLAMGCMLGESSKNPFPDKQVCEVEAARMYNDLTTPPWMDGLGPPEQAEAKCLTQEELDLTLGG